MKQFKFMSIIRRSSLPVAIFGTLVFSSLIRVSGQTTTFAQFFERNGSQDFVLTNKSSGADFKAVPGGSAVYFIFQNVANLDPSLQGIQSAHLYVTTNTTMPGQVAAGTLTQPLNQKVTVQIIRDSPPPPGVGGGLRTNLLTAVFSPTGNTPGIIGNDGGNSATLQASTPDHSVQFFSNFVSFGSTTARNLAFSFSSVTPTLVLGAGNFVDSSSSAASGTFASNPPPVYGNPTAAAVSLAGRVLTPDGVGLRNAMVTLTDQSGVVHEARTNSFGTFAFSDILSGQSVVVFARSKQYRFTPQLVNLSDNLVDVNFIGVN